MVRQREYECQPQDSGSEHSLPNYCELDYETEYPSDFESEQEFPQDPLFIARMPNMEESKSIRSTKFLPFSTYKERIREYLEQITDRQQIKFLWGTVIVLLILLCWSFMRTPSQPENVDLAFLDVPLGELHDCFEHSHASRVEQPLVLSETPTSIFDMDEEPDLVLPTTSIELTESASEKASETFAEPEPIRTVSNFSVWNREPQNTGEVETTWNNTSPSNTNPPAVPMDDGADFAALSQQWNTPDASDRTAFQSVAPPQFTMNPQEVGRYSQNVPPQQQNIPQNNVAQQAPMYPNPAFNQMPQQQNAPQGAGIYNAAPGARTNPGSYPRTQQPYPVQGNIVPNNIPNNGMNNTLPYNNQGVGYAQPQGIPGANASPYNMVNHREEIPANPTNNTYRNTGTTPYGAVQGGPYATDANHGQRLATSATPASRFDGTYSANPVQETPPTYQQQLNQQQYGNVPSYNNSQQYSQ